MQLFSVESNSAGSFIRFGSLRDFRAQTGPEGMEDLLAALAATTKQHAPSQIAAWEDSLSDLAFLLADPEGYASATEARISGISADLKAHADALRLDLSQLLADVDAIDSYVGISGKLMTPEELIRQKDLCCSVRERTKELEYRMFGKGEDGDTFGILEDRIAQSAEVFLKDLKRWRRRQMERESVFPDDSEVLLEYPLGPVVTVPSRVDVILRRGDRMAVIEQKQWTESFATDKRPDEQAEGYVARLKQEAGMEKTVVRGFAYLHNQIFYNGNLYQGRSLDKEKSYLYTRHFCCTMYRELAMFLCGEEQTAER